jgi:hypothetical protein
MKAKLSVLVYLDTDTEDAWKTCADNIRKASHLQDDELQMIWLDPYGLPDETVCRESDGFGAEAVREQCGPSAKILDVSGMEICGAYNVGITHAKGEWIAFSASSSRYAADALQKAIPDAEASGADLVSLCPRYRLADGLEKAYTAAPTGAADGLLDANENPQYLQLTLQAYLIRRSFLGDLRFREQLHEEAMPEMLLRLLMKSNGTYLYRKQSVYYYSVALEDDRDLTDLAEQRWWYEDSVRYFLLDFMAEAWDRYHGSVPVWLQAAVYYLMCAKYYCNLSGYDKQMLSAGEVPRFYDLCYELLLMIDNEVICQNGRNQIFEMKLPRALETIFLDGKAGKLGGVIRREQKEKKLCFCFEKDRSAEQMMKLHSEAVISRPEIIAENPALSSEICMGKLSDEVFNIQVLNAQAGMLEIDGFFKAAACLEPGSFELYGEIGGKEKQRVEIRPNEVYDLLKCFGVTYARKYAVHLSVPVESLLNQTPGFCVCLKYGGEVYHLHLEFNGMNSRLLTYSQKSYWRFDHDRYILSRSGKFLQVKKSGLPALIKKEALFDLVLLTQKNHREAVCSTGLRLLYWLTRPYYRRKRVWITFDKLYKAGDNGEYFFQHCQEKDDGIDCYYVINRDAPDAKRLVKQHPKRILYANTWKCRLMSLHAEAIMATHAGTASFLGFPGNLHRYFKNLYNPDNICIQHGLSIQNIASFQNRLYANTRLYCCASPFEMENISRPVYGYSSQMLKMTGLARYDGLKDKGKKQILITPTWRKNVVHTKGVGMKNDHSRYFRETAYFRIYNSLINDRELISCAKEHGYRIIFLLHPAMSAQMEDYDRNEFVELIQATGDMSYEKILTESSLMVTDYSGVQFDFAYQRKPLIYYHPDELPPHYEEGGLNYSTMGFGPICTNHAQIVGMLCAYMRDGCKMQDEYIRRADSFFAYDDFNNTERIYQEILKFEASK